MYLDREVSNIRIKTFNESQWETYKFLRLASLQESPDSFGSTFEREVAFTKMEWKSRIKSDSEAFRILPLFADIDGSPVGLASGVVHTSESDSVHVYQMWVSPDFRGNGIGEALLVRIEAWAKELKLGTLSLAVTTNNLNAVALYKSSGFVPSGSPEPLRDGSLLVVQPMELKLGTQIT